VFVLYVITGPTGKQYIGITSRTLARRWTEHKRDAKRGDETPLYRAMRKYGSSAFTVDQLATANSWDALCDCEIDAIASKATMVPRGYNLTNGGEGTLGMKNRVTWGAAISAAKKGRHSYTPTPETREKIASAQRGRVFTEQHKAKMRDAHKRRAAPSETTRQQTREAMLAVWAARREQPTKE